MVKMTQNSKLHLHWEKLQVGNPWFEVSLKVVTFCEALTAMSMACLQERQVSVKHGASFGQSSSYTHPT